MISVIFFLVEMKIHVLILDQPFMSSKTTEYDTCLIQRSEKVSLSLNSKEHMNFNDPTDAEHMRGEI